MKANLIKVYLGFTLSLGLSSNTFYQCNQQQFLPIPGPIAASPTDKLASSDRSKQQVVHNNSDLIYLIIITTIF
jgi:hypothetical protein